MDLVGYGDYQEAVIMEMEGDNGNYEGDAGALGGGNNSSTPVLYLRTNLGLMLFMSTALVVSTVVGSLGNLLVVLTISLVPSLRTCGNMFILNLALADLVITALVDPFNAAGAISGEHLLMGEHNTLCSVLGSICAPVCMSSMWNLSLISLNRYVRICHPHVYHRIFTAKLTFLMCASVWILCYAALIPTHTGWSRIIFDPDFYLCTADLIVCSEIGGILTTANVLCRNYYSYALSYITIGVFVPLLGVLFGYTQIFRTVRRAKYQIRRHKHGQVRGFGDTEKTLPKKAVKRLASITREDLTLVKTLFLAFVVFSVCWMPFALLVIAGHPISSPKWVYVMAMVMAHGNSAMNPILYGLSNDHFRRGYRHITRCRSQTTLVADETLGLASSLRPKLMILPQHDACWSSVTPNKATIYRLRTVDGTTITPISTRTPSPA